MMPPYRYLFNQRKLSEGEKPSPGALAVNLKPGYEITPKPEAEALLAYLMSLKADVPLAEAPVPTPPVKPAPPPPPPAP
jgi:cytochrome c oxidase cbb3-type subunit 2